MLDNSYIMAIPCFPQCSPHPAIFQILTVLKQDISPNISRGYATASQCHIPGLTVRCQGRDIVG